MEPGVRVFWSGGSGFGSAGVAFGAFLILLGILLFIWPQLLAWTLAGLLVVVGTGFVVGSLASGSATRYRRLDDLDGPPPF